MNRQHPPTMADWEARDAAWQTRVRKLGVERSIYHSGHDAPDFPSVTALQQDAIWPHLVASVQGTRGLALDFGCGHGRWTRQLADLVGYAIGVDPTGALLAYAAEHRAQPNVDYRPYVHGTIPVDAAAADVLWVCMVLSTVLDDGMFHATLEELRRVTHPGSVVCLIDNTSRVDGGPVNSKYSKSRSIEEYIAAFAPWADVSPVGEYVDLGEINTVFTGRVHG